LQEVHVEAPVQLAHYADIVELAMQVVAEARQYPELQLKQAFAL
jgi:hypothetical protein